MSRIDHHTPTQTTWLDMDLEMAGRACLAQLPALAARRMRGYRRELRALQAVATDSASAQRLARKWFDLMANASVHRGGADTLRPLFEHCSLVRTYLWLRDRVHVTAPEPLVRGTPDLLVEASGDALVCRVMGDDFVILAASAAAFEGLETRLGEGVLAGSGVRLEVERMPVDEAAIARLQGLL